jgi:glucose-1-phosphate adenylyltransferase
MELLTDFPPLNLYDEPWRIFSRNPNEPPHFVGAGAEISNSMISEGCLIYGKVENSILSSGVIVGKGAVVRDSIIMTETKIGEGSTVDMSIIDEEVQVGKRAVIGEFKKPGAKPGRIAIIGKGAKVGAGALVEAGKQIDLGEVVKKTASEKREKSEKVVAKKTTGKKAAGKGAKS